jgi:hypothetical protein
MVHHLNIIHWFFESKQPALATAIMHNYNTAGPWETFNTTGFLLDYLDENYQVYFEGTFFNARDGAMMQIMVRPTSVHGPCGAAAGRKAHRSAIQFQVQFSRFSTGKMGMNEVPPQKFVDYREKLAW